MCVSNSTAEIPFHVDTVDTNPEWIQQGSHSDWKTWKNGKVFSSQGKVREKSGKITQYTGKIREFEINII